ncbi:hypothetical protein UCREL1_2347 [Eutypa lata UCREL1]|uniref:Uncharacterized protein n=1 Tax=Eutypa lata (strain UCR-EL1) TaxID=1287681 RepID=M7T270_EUTLA|nr:hypothetical protein UCREL1_2347 [Eutypa lata UCREL1]
MAAEDWLAHLKTAGSAMLWALGWMLNICYLVAIPLYYPLYYAFHSVLFVLSPAWYVFGTISSAAGVVVEFVVRLKLAYAAIIGILAGCVLHGTSNLIFVLLGVDSSSTAAEQKNRHGGGSSRRRRLAAGSEDEDGGGMRGDRSSIELEFWSGDTTTTSTSTTSAADSRRSTTKGQQQKEPALDYGELFDSKWKLLRASEKPRRRRRGLLAQTIHEESSESDSL